MIHLGNKKFTGVEFCTDKRKHRSSKGDCLSRDSWSKNGERVINKSRISCSKMGNFFSWALSVVYKSPAQYLKEAELQILQKFTNTSCQSQFIPISNDVEIRTLRFDLGFPKNTPAVVLLHGLFSGLGVWSPCFDLLAQRCLVYAIDLPGFGRSTRTQFFGHRSDIDYQFVSYIEEWRDAVGLDSFVLVAHGFSGYLATLYSIKYPERVRHLILVEPWGFTELPFAVVGKAAKIHGDQNDESYEENLPSFIKIVNYILNIFNPVDIVRRLPFKIARWIYYKFLEYTSPSLTEPKEESKQVAIMGQSHLEIYSKYLYYCNSLRPTGQCAFSKLNLFYFWAKSPIMYQVRQLDENVPMSFIYGSRSTVDHKTGYEVYHQRQTSSVEVYMIHNAGHNLFIDSPERFCDIVISTVENECTKETNITSIEGSENGMEDLYWDCAWETINLSHANLHYIENGIQDTPFEEWDDFEFDEMVSSKYESQLTSEKSDDEEVFYPLD